MVKEKNNFSIANICFDCEKACGGCSWSEYDPKKGGTRFEVPPGATYESVYTPEGKFITYHITDCPLFVRSDKRSGTNGALTEDENDLFLKDIDSFYRKYSKRR